MARLFLVSAIALHASAEKDGELSALTSLVEKQGQLLSTQTAASAALAARVANLEALFFEKNNGNTHPPASFVDPATQRRGLFSVYGGSETRIDGQSIKTRNLNVTDDLHIGGRIFWHGKEWEPDWVPTGAPSSPPTVLPSPEPTPGPTSAVWNLAYHIPADAGPSFNGYTCQTSGVAKPSESDLTNPAMPQYCLGLNNYAVDSRTIFRLGCHDVGLGYTQTMYVKGITDLNNAFNADLMSSIDSLECSYYQDFRESEYGCGCLSYYGAGHTYWSVMERDPAVTCFSEGSYVNGWAFKTPPDGSSYAMNYAFFSPGATYSLRHCIVGRFTAVAGESATGWLHFSDPRVSVP